MTVNRFDHPFQSSDVFIFRDRDLPFLHLPYRIHHPAGTGENQARTTTRLLLVEIQNSLPPEATLLAEIDPHRSNYQAVGDFQRANPPGREKAFV